jgi:signal peptidase I
LKETSVQEIKPRKPIVALLLSAILPGFGQLYNGEVNRGIWLFIAFVFVNIPWLALIGLTISGVLLLPLLLLTLATAVAIWVFGMRDAWRHAKARQDFVPERWQCSGLFALVFIICNLIALPALTMHVRAHYVQPFRIPSASNEPSVMRGDFIFADMRYNCPGCKYRIEQGDIAVFAEPNNRTRLFIKRIIGLPGDVVTIQGTTVSVNGESLTAGTTDAGSGEFIERSSDGREWAVQWNPARAVGGNDTYTVPPGHVFVLGDNRSNSVDSRQIGTVPMQDVVGRARQVWFSHSPESGVRWDRIGRLLE